MLTRQGPRTRRSGAGSGSAQPDSSRATCFALPELHGPRAVPRPTLPNNTLTWTFPFNGPNLRFVDIWPMTSHDAAGGGSPCRSDTSGSSSRIRRNRADSGLARPRGRMRPHLPRGHRYVVDLNCEHDEKSKAEGRQGRFGPLRPSCPRAAEAAGSAKNAPPAGGRGAAKTVGPGRTNQPAAGVRPRRWPHRAPPARPQPRGPPAAFRELGAQLQRLRPQFAASAAGGSRRSRRRLRARPPRFAKGEC